MAHENVVREIVTDLDATITGVQRLVERSANGDRRELALAVVKLQEARFWLREVGHGSHLDAPESVDAPAD